MSDPTTGIADLPAPPFYAVIFTSVRTQVDEGYAEMADKMVALAAQQPGFLGVESVRADNGLGITVSYWQDEASIKGWRQHAEHQLAIQKGHQQWYEAAFTRVAKVERAYGFGK
ncbi:antibiotic biosynthesis monooxygenase family protein [Leeia oryzae]|uniref:antibiotic biosynthesis monooxygenase family protein n=1 Tax=Leeia oryzae TaxID=356662 RepID=UPI000376CF35|nr:antibiotic biosynthesis monooxygenase [Leeia oryzae]